MIMYVFNSCLCVPCVVKEFNETSSNCSVSLSICLASWLITVTSSLVPHTWHQTHCLVYYDHLMSNECLIQRVLMQATCCHGDHLELTCPKWRYVTDQYDDNDDDDDDIVDVMMKSCCCCCCWRWHMTSLHDVACATSLVGFWTKPANIIIIFNINRYNSYKLHRFERWILKKNYSDPPDVMASFQIPRQIRSPLWKPSSQLMMGRCVHLLQDDSMQWLACILKLTEASSFNAWHHNKTRNGGNCHVLQLETCLFSA